METLLGRRQGHEDLIGGGGRSLSRSEQSLLPPHASAAAASSSMASGLRCGMALELRPNCESCNVDLPPASTDAWICTYECTFCTRCVEGELGNVCPNCGGGFERRPIRPRTEWRPGLSVEHQPPSDKRYKLSYSRENVRALRERVQGIAPKDR